MSIYPVPRVNRWLHFRTATILLGLCLTFWVLLASCQGGSSGGTAPRAIAEGRYQVVSSPVCRPSGQTPAYPEPRFKAVIYDFYPLVEHEIIISQDKLIHRLSTEDCLITITRTILENRWSSFAVANHRMHSFEPPECTIPLSFDGGELPYGSFSQIFNDSDEASIDLAKEITSDEQSSYFLATPPAQSIDNRWVAFGCQQLDQLVFAWHKSAE